MPYCRNCGDEVEAGWKACPHCGQPDPTNTGNFAAGAPHGSEDRGGWSRQQKLFAVLGGLILLLIIAAVAGSGEDDESPVAAETSVPTTRTATLEPTQDPTPRATAEPTPQPTAEPTPEPAPAQDVVVEEWSGSGAMTTRPFTVGDGWEIQWTFSGDIFQIYLYDEQGNLEGVPANGQDGGEGSAYRPTGGTYYMEMNAIGSWTTRVVDVAT